MNVRLLTTLAAAQFPDGARPGGDERRSPSWSRTSDTTVTTIQAIIAFYALVMAGLMLIGGKLGDIYGRKRSSRSASSSTACGLGAYRRFLSVASLALGWSVLEGIGAAMVMPAMVALVASNFEGKNQAIAYGCWAAWPGSGSRSARSSAAG